MFANEVQRARVCCAVLEAAGIGINHARPETPKYEEWTPGMDGDPDNWLWSKAGPTPLAIDLLQRDGGGMSSGERIMFLAAWSIWNGDGNLRFHDVAYRIDSRNLECLGSLLLAINAGADAIEEWLLGRGV